MITTIIAAIIGTHFTFPKTKMAVGPSAPPIIAVEPAP